MDYSRALLEMVPKMPKRALVSEDLTDVNVLVGHWCKAEVC